LATTTLVYSALPRGIIAERLCIASVRLAAPARFAGVLPLLLSSWSGAPSRNRPLAGPDTAIALINYSTSVLDASTLPITLWCFADPEARGALQGLGEGCQPRHVGNEAVVCAGRVLLILGRDGAAPARHLAQVQSHVLSRGCPEQRSFVLWKRAHPDDHPRRAGAIVEALRVKFPGAKLVLAGHSAGGALTFSYLDGVEKIADDVERIAWLDSNYAYDAAKGHAKKLATWLEGSNERQMVVLAYQDYVALLNGKTSVSENGGTWGRSLAMLRDFGAEGVTWTRSDGGEGVSFACF
jgi:hypothetical protein